MKPFFGTLILLAALGCWSGPSGPFAGPLPQYVRRCAPGTVASYANTTCSQGRVTYSFPPLSSLYSATGTTGANSARDIRINLDRLGPQTLLLSSPDWHLTRPGESFSVTLTFEVDGATRTGGWQHDCYVTGDGRVSESTEVDTGQIARTYCTAAGTVDRAPVSFPAGRHSVTVKIEGSSGSYGAASLRSYGTHFD
ncbi:MAG TPA: hypothetical protein VI455_14080 [Terriglobia bacterium]